MLASPIPINDTALLSGKRLGGGQIASTETTIYTVPASTIGTVLVLILTNITGTAATVEVWHDVGGGGTSDGELLLKGFSVPANDFIQIYTYIPMAATDKLILKGGTNDAITATAYGTEN
jgi:hypothetical protein